MVTYDEHRRSVLDLFVELAAAAYDAGAVELNERLAAAQQRLIDDRLVAVVLGEFKRGKSTLLNALLAEPGLFPVDTYVATRLVTTASWAPEEKVTVVVDRDGEAPRQQQISRAEIAVYAAEAPAGGQPASGGEARTVHIEIPNERLASGLVLVDTPGIGGIYQAHTAVTLAFLPSADAVIYVVDSSQPLLAGELAFIRRAALAVDAERNPDAMIFVVTKADTVADPTPIVDDTRKQLAVVTGRPPDQLVVIPVSSTARLRYLADGDQEDQEASNFDELEATLWRTLGRSRARLVIGGALAVCDAVLNSLMLPLTSGLAAVDADTEADRKRLADAAERTRAHLDRLAGDEAQWPDELRAAMRQIAAELTGHAYARLDELWEQQRGHEIPGYEATPRAEELLGRFEEDMSLLVGALGEQATTAASKVLREFGGRVEIHGLQSAEILPVPDIPTAPVLALPPAVPFDAADEGARRVASALRAAIATGEHSAELGARLGSLIGSGFRGVGRLGGTVLGGAAGALIGTVLAYRQAIEGLRTQDEDARRREVAHLLRSLRDQQQQYLHATIEHIVDDLGRTIEAQLRDRIADHQAALTATEHEIAVSTAARDEEATRRRADIERRLGPLRALRHRISALAGSIEDAQ